MPYNPVFAACEESNDECDVLVPIALMVSVMSSISVLLITTRYGILWVIMLGVQAMLVVAGLFLWVSGS